MKILSFKITIILLIYTLKLNSQFFSPDSSFGVNGLAKFIVPEDVENIYSPKLLNNGKLIYSSSHYSRSYPAYLYMTRLNDNGTKDIFFGLNSLLDLRYYEFIPVAINTFSDKSILLTANGYTDQINLLKITENGKIDSKFGAKGLKVIDILPGKDTLISSFIQSDNKIILIGDIFLNNVKTNFITRLDQDGKIDSSFGTHGKTITSISKYPFTTLKAIQTQNKDYLILGSSYDGLIYFPAILRLDSNGILKTSFGNKGNIRIRLFDENVYGTDIIEDSHSSFYLSGNNKGRPFRNFLLKFNESGIQDKSYGENGICHFSFRNYNTVIKSITSQSNGNLILTGNILNDTIFTYPLLYGSYITKINDSGIQDHTIGTNGFYFPGDSFPSRINSVDLKLINDNKLLLTFMNDELGTFSYYSSIAFYRYNLQDQNTFTNNPYSAPKVEIYPNPCHIEEPLYINISHEDRYTISFMNISGNKIINICNNILLPVGRLGISPSFNSLHSGIYFVNIRSRNYNKTIKLLIQ